MRETFRQDLNTAARLYGLSMTDQQNECLLQYLELLFKWNKAYNLTAIRKPEEMFIKHLLDSISIAPYIKGKRILDVGTGPGLPGIPLAILFPDNEFVLLDSNGKKTRFLVQVQMSLNIKNIKIINDRVERVTDNLKFDQIVSRAFTALDNMVEICKHLLTESGQFLAMKGLIPQKEIALLDADYTITEIQPLTVPGCQEQRHLVVVSKA